MNRPLSTTRLIPRPRRAFTLIEVLVVVTILGIAAAMVVPHMMRPGSMAIQAASRALIADLLAAQTQAIATHAPHRLVVDVAGNSYRVVDASNATVPRSASEGPFAVNFTTDRRFQTVRIAAADFGGHPSVSFDELGGPGTGGTIDLSADGYVYRITVAPFTGRVNVALIAQPGD